MKDRKESKGKLRPGLAFESGAEEDLCTFLTGLDGFFSFVLSRSAGLCFGFVPSGNKNKGGQTENHCLKELM